MADPARAARPKPHRLTPAQVAELKTLFLELLIMASLERERPGRAPRDWIRQMHRVATVVGQRDHDVVALAADLEGPFAGSRHQIDYIYGPYMHAIRVQEMKVVKLIADAEAQGLLPPVAEAVA